MTLIDNAYLKAIDVIRACVKPTGFYASGLPGGYEATWARDSMTTTLGAALLGDEFKLTIKKSIALLKKNQTELGLIPNCVGSYNTERKSDVTFNSVDAPLWYIIGQFACAEAFKDDSILNENKKSLEAALTWLKYQDPNNDLLIVTQPTGDWMDAFPHKYGRVLNNLALYYGALKLMGEGARAEQMKKIINGETQTYLSLFDKKLGYYLPWVWKGHDSIREQEEYFDSAANLTAIITGLATPAIAKSILKYIEKEKINRPYPCKVIWPPIKQGDKEWHDYFANCDAREPYHYLNGGIWPFIGGLYVAALVKAGEFKKAETELELLSEAVLKKFKIRDLKEAYEFNEWLDGQTGEPQGEPYQAWSAGMFVYAYECVKRKRVLYF